MGGKKKTKWRKLPLAEFTKDCQNDQTLPSEEICQPELSRNERKEAYLPPYETTENGVSNNYETSEYLDGSFWFPTSCVVYNPAEVSLYPNYLIPSDTFYYYYTMPEVPQMQEYVSVPYQEYCAHPPKDTVYLLLPTQSVRPSQGSPHIVSDWQNRRWRRRYEGYSDYTFVNEKTNTVSNSREERDRGKKTAQHVSPRRYSNQSNYQKRINSHSENCSLKLFSESVAPQHNNGDSNPVKRLASPVENCEGTENTVLKSKKMAYVTDNSSQRTKKNFEMCAIHAKSQKSVPESSEFDIRNENEDCLFTDSNIKLETELCSQTDMSFTPSGKLDLHRELPNNISVADFHSTSFKDTPNIQTEFSEPKDHVNDIRLSISSASTPEENIFRNEVKSTQNGEVPRLKDLNDSKDRDFQNTHITDILNENTTNLLSKSEKHNDSISRTNSQSSLPDILSTLNKSLLSKTRGTSSSPNIEKFRKSYVPDKTDNENEKSHPSKSLVNQIPFLPNLLNSDNEIDTDLKQLTCLQSLPANQSIYKLAFDENVTDQSEVDSRSPSPVDPESQVPSSLTNAEILIHEADSGSEAGSEDVELLPHRYESETSLNEKKHVYVNKLSLAVELLRTQESLPYDDEFKRVVGENNLTNIGSQKVPGGKVNLGFIDDSSLHLSNASDSSEFSNFAMSKNVVKEKGKITQHCSTNQAMRDILFEDLDESCEIAKEATVQTNDNQDSTEEIRAGYRRFGVQARHYFSPRAALVNPCFCCIIM